jgi:hypothetical protein
MSDFRTIAAVATGVATAYIKLRAFLDGIMDDPGKVMLVANWQPRQSYLGGV